WLCWQRRVEVDSAARMVQGPHWRGRRRRRWIGSGSLNPPDRSAWTRSSCPTPRIAHKRRKAASGPSDRPPRVPRSHGGGTPRRAARRPRAGAEGGEGLPDQLPAPGLAAQAVGRSVSARPTGAGICRWPECWWGFGRLTTDVRAEMEKLEAEFDAPERVTDDYLWIPGSRINVKLRSKGNGSLKFKRVRVTD